MEAEALRRLAMAESVLRHSGDQWPVPWLLVPLLLLWMVLICWEMLWPR